MTQVFTQLSFEIGLEQVSFHHEPQVSPGALPADDLAPSNPRFELQLPEVLYAPASYEQRLLGALRPKILHRDVIQPQVFSEMIDSVLHRLKNRSFKTSTAADQEKTRGAATRLEELHTLSQLLRQSQHALHRV